MPQIITVSPAVEVLTICDGVDGEESTYEVVSEKVAAPAATTEQQARETDDVTTEEVAIPTAVAAQQALEAEKVTIEASAEAKPVKVVTEVKKIKEDVPGVLIKASEDGDLVLLVRKFQHQRAKEPLVNYLETLTKYFSKYGKVAICEILLSQKTGKATNFGYVKFENIEGIEKALAATDHSINGRKIEVVSTLWCAELNMNSIIVHNLELETTDASIKNYFATFGEIKTFRRPHLTLDRSTGLAGRLCFVRYKEYRSVDKCLKIKHEIDGKKLEVEVSCGRRIAYHGGQLRYGCGGVQRKFYRGNSRYSCGGANKNCYSTDMVVDVTADNQEM